MTIPAATQGWGGQIYILKGVQIDIVNRSLTIDDTTRSEYIAIAAADDTSSADFFRHAFNGGNSWFPSSYANLKPMAFGVFNGRSRLFESLNVIQDDEAELYVGGWDGSGLFVPKGGGLDSWRGGRGFDLVSPSGSHNVRTRDHVLINHNNQVFGIGYHMRSDTASTSNWIDELGWNFHLNNLSVLDTNENRRTYRVFVLEENGKKTMTPPTRVSTVNALNREHLNSCDAISYKGDIYYSNWIDVLRFPGGSGTPEIMYDDINNPRARSFGLWPSGGFSNSVANGPINLLMLESDGSLYKLNPPASGRNLLVDLTDVRVNSSNRTGDNFLARINSATAEPGRPPFLIPFNNELHAFFITATSGYQHFTCNGNPSGTSNWTDRTDDMPLDIRRNDSCIYGFEDSVRQKLNILQVSYSKFGLFGSAGGGQNSGGGMWTYYHDINRNWIETNRAVIGMPPRGFIPYQNLGPFASVPSGINPEVFKCNDYTILTYKLYDQQARSVDVDIEFSTDEGITWNTARRFKTYDTGELLGSGVTNLPTSPDGIEYEFYFDHVNSIGFDTVKATILRVRPKINR